MRKTIHTITLCIILTIFALATGACEKKQQEKQEAAKQAAPKEMSTAKASDKHQENVPMAVLFKTKCTKCHDAKRAEDMHVSKESFVDIIKEMIKKGAEIDDQQEKELAEFLATPSRFLLRENCTKCHTLDRIFEAHEKGTLTKDTLKKMQKKEGSGITEKEVDSIYEGFDAWNFVSPQIPMSPGF